MPPELRIGTAAANDRAAAAEGNHERFAVRQAGSHSAGVIVAQSGFHGPALEGLRHFAPGLRRLCSVHRTDWRAGRNRGREPGRVESREFHGRGCQFLGLLVQEPVTHGVGAAQALHTGELESHVVAGRHHAADLPGESRLLVARPFQLRQDEARLDAADTAGVRFQAHALKGAAATVAAEGLQALAQAIERADDGSRLNSCGALLPRAVEEYERFKSAIEEAGWV